MYSCTVVAEGVEFKHQDPRECEENVHGVKLRIVYSVS